MFSGAMAVMVTVPGARHVAVPFVLIVATVTFELAQVKPSFAARARVVLLLRVPVAAKATWLCGLLVAVAELGATLMLSNLGPLPQLRDVIAITTASARVLCFMIQLQGLRESCAEKGCFGSEQTRASVTVADHFLETYLKPTALGLAYIESRSASVITGRCGSQT
jgi:hypothetical protein